MKIITLKEEEFDLYATRHPYRNYYQTTTYGNIMKKHGYNVHYLGFINNQNQVVGASLVLYQTIFVNYKYVYAPRGLLIDYGDKQAIKEIADRLKKLLVKQNFIFIKIDPLIYCTERKKDGKAIAYNPEINNVIETLKKAGFEHRGFNQFFETVKPRWEAVVKLNKTEDELYHNLAKATRNKIRKATRCGINFYKEEGTNIYTLYELIKRKQNKSFEYYQDLIQFFKEKDMIEIYYTKMNPEICVENSKSLYEKELQKNDQLTKTMQDSTTKGKDKRKLINKKMESDKLLNYHKNNLILATKLLQEHPAGIIVGGAIVLKYIDKAYLLIDGINEDYKQFYPNHLLRFELIKIFKKQGYKEFNLGAVVGDFNRMTEYSGLNEMKMNYGAVIAEYAGEFDYIINPAIYNLYRSLKPADNPLLDHNL